MELLIKKCVSILVRNFRDVTCVISINFLGFGMFGNQRPWTFTLDPGNPRDNSLPLPAQEISGFSKAFLPKAYEIHTTS